jgi:putative ABC transport system permease protein
VIDRTSRTDAEYCREAFYTRLKESSQSMEHFFRDLRYSFRTFRNTPGFTLTAIAALALGIGANTAIFSVINTVLLKPVAAPDPGRIVVFGTTRPDGPPVGASPTRFNVCRQMTNLFQDVSAYRFGTMNLTGVDSPEQVQIGQVSEAYFRLFGISAARGRTFTAAEDRPNAGHFVVLSNEFWKRALGGDSHMLGKTISLSGSPYVVIGILGPGVETESPLPIDVWVPFQIDPETADQNHYFVAAGRIKPGVTAGMIKPQLDRAAEEFRHKYPGVSTMPPGATFVAEPIENTVARNVRSSLLVLAGAVSFVLLIACANVANLLLVRAVGRQREIAIRAAVGASRGRIIRQLLTESLALSLAGGALGLVCGVAGIRALLALNPGNIPRIGANGAAVTLDWRVVAFTALISVATSIVFGLIPALPASRIHRFGTTIRQQKMRSFLVAGEMALALVLLVGSGLLIRTFLAMRAVDLGFDPHNVLTMQISLSDEKYQKAAALAGLARSSLERIRAVPGVEYATAGCCMPLGSVPIAPFVIAGRAVNGTFHGRAGAPTVSPDYFNVFQIPILRGRMFTERDGAGAPAVAIISQARAKQFWPNADPMGQKISLGRTTQPNRTLIEIVGIARDVHDRTERASDPSFSTIYIPLAQNSDAYTAYMVRLPTLWMIRTRMEPHSLAPAIKSELQRAAGGLPVTGIRSMDEIVAQSTARQDFNMALMLIFGGAALLLAAIGIYGLMAFAVEQRRQEIGIRVALGAEASDVRRMVVWQGMRLALAGIAVGIAAAFGLTRMMASLLYGIPTRDPLVFAAVPLVLSLVALLGVWLPARRASRIDPVQALRE